MFIKYIVMLIVRKKLGLKLYEPFRFKSQYHKEDYYCFGKYELIKNEYHALYFRDGTPFVEVRESQMSRVALNFLLADSTKNEIEKVCLSDFQTLEEVRK